MAYPGLIFMLCLMVTILMAGLKLAGFAALSWLAVLMPMILWAGVTAAIIVVGVVALLVLAVGAVLKK